MENHAELDRRTVTTNTGYEPPVTSSVYTTTLLDTTTEMETPTSTVSAMPTTTQGASDCDIVKTAFPSLTFSGAFGCYDKIKVPSGPSGRYTYVSAWDLGSNMLSGNVPSSLGNLQKLATLVLSNNKFSGPLPPALQSNNFTVLKLDGNCVNGQVPLGGSNVASNGCATAKPTTTNTKPTYTPSKTVDCFPKSMSKYVTKPTSLSTPNVYGIHGDARNATCDPALQARNTHCLGICVVQCVGEPYNAWKYLACSGGRVCKKIGRFHFCLLPSSNPVTTTLAKIQQTSTPTLPQPTLNYIAPVPTTTENTAPVYQPTPVVSEKCYDYSVNGPFVPSTGPTLYGPDGDAEGATCDTKGQVNNLAANVNICRSRAVWRYTATYNALPAPNIYGAQGDALDAPCDTEGQVNNTHCIGACVAQCAQILCMPGSEMMYTTYQDIHVEAFSISVF
ncbi:hypothetical protein HDU76_011617 [Blyttiomyces sp. JEL0837]|nr:hypothetical protein HDU76_011617 [Blyttiomyces sp. JEL0837]